MLVKTTPPKITFAEVPHPLIARLRAPDILALGTGDMIFLLLFTITDQLFLKQLGDHHFPLLEPRRRKFLESLAYQHIRREAFIRCSCLWRVLGCTRSARKFL